MIPQRGIAMCVSMWVAVACQPEAAPSSQDMTERGPRVQPGTAMGVKSRVVCKSERKLLDASVRLPWRPPSVREA